MKKRRLAVLVAVLFIIAILPINATATQPITVFVNDEQLQNDARPVLKDNRVLVPLRAIFELLGTVVNYDTNTKTITATRGETTICLQILATKGFRNGEAIPLDVPAIVIQDRTMVPLRFVSEALGAVVNWDAGTRTVNINLETEVTEASDIANSIAWEFIRNDIEHYESSGKVKIIDSKITRLDLIKKFDGLADTPVYVFALEYRLLPDDLSKVILAGGMQLDDDGWLMQTCSAGNPLLVISRQNGESLHVGTLWTGTILEEGGDLKTAVKVLLERN